MIIVVVDLWGIGLLYRHNALIRLISVAHLEAVHPKSPANSQDVRLQQFNGHDPVEIMEKVMNAVDRTEKYDSDDLSDIMDHVARGGGLVCSGMMALYSGALNANGIENRHVVLLRNMYGVYDAHTVVEVYENRRWVIYDPTFNVSFEKNGRKIGAQEISQSLYNGSEEDIKIVYYGDVAYPARLDTYYMNWRPLYNNVFVMENSQGGILTKLPPLRYWFGPTYYVQPHQTSEYIQPYWYQFQQEFYFVFVVLLPISAMLLGAVSIILIYLRASRKSQKTLPGE